MAYPSRLLDDDESVIVDLHPHWWYLARPAAALIASIAASIATLVATDVGSAARRVAMWATLAALAASAAWLLTRYARWSSTYFVVSDRRVIFRTGLLSKRGIEMALDRITTVHFRQGMLERVVGAGELMVESAGESAEQWFTDIREPDRIQRVIHAEIDARARRQSGGVVDIAAQLEQLEALVERGTLTADEFDRQKRRLLGR